MSFGGWLDARDGETVQREWATLDATRVEVGQFGPPYYSIRPHGAALLAASWLGCSPERFIWFAADYDNDYPKPPPSTYHKGRAARRTYLDGGRIKFDEECHEEWQVWEIVEGTRGVQFVVLNYEYGEMTREGGNGGSAKIVRVFDRATSRALSIPLWGNEVWTIGEPIDLTLLDLFALRPSFKLAWKQYDPDSLRGLVALVAADLDAHFDTCTSWPGGVTEDRLVENKEYNYRVRVRTYRFESGSFAIELDENLHPDTGESRWLAATVHGLPWGHEVRIHLSDSDDPVFGVTGFAAVMLPRAPLEATLARLAKIPHLTITE